jgi:iron complex outermembrane receptor protein
MRASRIGRVGAARRAAATGAHSGAARRPAGARNAGTAATGNSGIVGASTTVITAEDIAHSPAQTVQEIIAQVPGVQLTSCSAA